MSAARATLVALALIGLGACAGDGPPPRDYTSFRENLPRSILALPPINHSVEVNGPYSFLSTITQPLAEAGYYVFPVAVVDQVMKENGLPLPADMHAAPLDKLREVFGADAVLYVDLIDYGQSYKILTSVAEVRAEAQLVDLETGMPLWRGDAVRVRGSGGDNNDVIGLLIQAAITQMIDSTTDRAHGLAAEANWGMIFDREDGLLLGPYHRAFDEDARGLPPPVEE